MYDYVLVFFGGTAIGMLSGYLYCKHGKWKLSEIIEGADQILHNPHFISHLKGNPGLKDKLGPLYDWLIEHAPDDENGDADAVADETEAENKAKKIKVKKSKKVKDEEE